MRASRGVSLVAVYSGLVLSLVLTLVHGSVPGGAGAFLRQAGGATDDFGGAGPQLDYDQIRGYTADDEYTLEEGWPSAGGETAVDIRGVAGLGSSSRQGRGEGDGGDEFGAALGRLQQSAEDARREEQDKELLARLLQVLKQKLRMPSSRRSYRKRSRSQAIRINKRHCWDVADVCCMWNICS